MSAGLTAEQALEADAGWYQAYLRMVSALRGLTPGSEDPGLPAEDAVMTPMERYARAVSLSSSPGVSLALTLPMAFTAASVAGQGAFWLKVKEASGNRLDVPGILQATMIAPSGYGKSTVLEPLVKMLDGLSRKGFPRRHKIVAEQFGLVAKTYEDSALGKEEVAKELARLKLIYDMGKCHQLTLDSATPEGVRGALLKNGSVAGILTAEPDILREIAGYSKDGGTYRWLLDGWGGSKVAVARAQKTMVVPRTVLPYAIVVQPVAFDQFTKAEKDEAGLAKDTALGRGLYGRSWLSRIETFGQINKAYGLDQLDNAEEIALLGGVAGSHVALEEALEKQIQRGEQYRVRMGICIGWEAAIGEGDESGAEPPKLPDRIWLELSEEAFGEFVMVQNIRLALMDLVMGLSVQTPGLDTVFMPMVSRVTQHVLRLALVMQLGVLPEGTVVHGWAVRDAGQRLVPWLLEHWCTEMHRYVQKATVELHEQEVRHNKTGDDVSYQGRVIKAIGLVIKAKCEGMDEGVVQTTPFTRSEIIERAKRMYQKESRPQMHNPLLGSFMELVAAGYVAEVSKKGNSVKYAKTAEGIAHGV